MYHKQDARYEIEAWYKIKTQKDSKSGTLLEAQMERLSPSHIMEGVNSGCKRLQINTVVRRVPAE